ncbi:protocatechuate 3,4-dioxygenase subunit alpha [Actinomadura alba]|uniref:Protocatechuate 3,4-dioxygenase subunit alpha n=1 Tax=Actinomadura alba TaxID=406431 RepID=A0ABR7M0U7_9ACTN|nr:protocatechuate 3,4-dioxygenase subunit alpha [Actinomadura alba]MBC6470365.1 protocatechuate 3,4-dioxygenase subunit alpha [Actinomadura alba]
MMETGHETLPVTPSQTVGPFFGYALPYDDGPRVAPQWHPDAITLRGTVLDGAGDPLPDAILEIWQADADGTVPSGEGGLLRAGHGFSGFGRCPTDSAGRYWFSTVKPGPVGGAAPYIAVLVFARGLLKPVATRLYFPEETEANAADPVLSAVDAERRGTLVAQRENDGGYRFDIRLQGDGETVFFAS